MVGIPEPDSKNAWRLATRGNEGWVRSARPDSPEKYFMVSADGHVQEPSGLWRQRLDQSYADRLPTIVVDSRGRQYQKTEGFGEARIHDVPLEGEDLLRQSSGRTPEERLADHEADGIDCEILFPNKGLTVFATRDVQFSQAMCRVYNEWAWEVFGPFNDRLSPMACIASGDVPGAIAEVERCANQGFRGLTLPSKPIYGPGDHYDTNYNMPEFDPLWACIQDVDLPVTFHVSTGHDPRTSRGKGGAIINYAVHSLAPTMEPIANLCASGVVGRFPRLRFGTVEAGIGWVAWALGVMDEAYRKHHMWVRPKLDRLPSEYFKSNGFATFQEDKVGLDLARSNGLIGNFMWANDYPHHEGTWPHSAQAIERTMGDLTDVERAQILGLNAARVFRFEVPPRYWNHADVAALTTLEYQTPPLDAEVS